MKSNFIAAIFVLINFCVNFGLNSIMLIAVFITKSMVTDARLENLVRLFKNAFINIFAFN